MEARGPITIDTTLGSAVAFNSMVGTERLGRPFEYHVDVLSTRRDLKASDLLGQPVTVNLETAVTGVRYWNGIVTQFAYVGHDETWTVYRLVVRPWLWFLTRSANCKIFQAMSVPDIITAVFRDRGFADFEQSLSETYAPLEYVVQYGETDYNFVSRLMEREGIYYYFRHEQAKHTLVLADSLGAHHKTPGCETLPFRPPDPHRNASVEYVESWELLERVEPGIYSHADFDFKKSSLALYSSRAAPKDHAGSASEVYEYPGGFLENAAGDARAKIRLEQLQMPFQTASGVANARGLTVGSLFALDEHPREDQNTDYLVVSAQYRLSGHELTSGDDGDDAPFGCDFDALDAKVPFRMSAVTPRPVMRGPQTATVVGKDGEEIWTDEYGRVKVQFHWDRDGKRDENSSCFVRVAQVWAGDGWGGVHIPRMGQEVIVDFLEGDPDQPIITGRVYNGDNMPPYALPDNQTQSGIKSRSTKGGSPSNFNEIRFEDKKGSEELYMQAEKNRTTLVKNDQTTTVKANRSASVGASDSVTVGGDRSVHVTGNLSTVVDGGGKSPVHSEVTVTGKHALHASDTIEMDAPTHIQFKCGDSVVLIEPGKITLTAGGKATIVLDANVLAQSKDGTKVVLDANALASASTGAKMVLDANVNATSKSNSQLLLDGNAGLTTNGDVGVKGMNVEIEGKTQVTAKVAANSVQMSSSGTAVAGATVNVNGTGMVSIGGPIIKIG
jgi:type VI secretion system secreted protein VgrG